MTEHIWTFPATVNRVVDGDTLDVRADLGFRCFADVRVRLRGVDTAETYGVSRDSEEYALGTEHREFVETFVEHDDTAEWPFTLITEKQTGKYGRWAGDLYRRADDTWLTDALVEAYPEVEDA